MTLPGGGPGEGIPPGAGGVLAGPGGPGGPGGPPCMGGTPPGGGADPIGGSVEAIFKVSFTFQFVRLKRSCKTATIKAAGRLKGKIHDL
jgi:hypothetical protein